MMQPTYNKVVIKPAQEAEKVGSIFLPPTSVIKSRIGEVVAVGPGRTEAGVLIPCCCKVGDKVMFARNIGLPIQIDGVDHLLLPDVEILAIINDIDASTLKVGADTNAPDVL